MLDISDGCINDNTYGISCTYCCKCGRKFSYNGVDDSDVISKSHLNESNNISLLHEIEILKGNGIYGCK